VVLCTRCIDGACTCGIVYMLYRWCHVHVMLCTCCAGGVVYKWYCVHVLHLVLVYMWCCVHVIHVMKPAHKKIEKID